MPIVCPKCGAAVPEGARFCELDGTRIDDSPAQTATTAFADAVAAIAAACACGASIDEIVEGYCSQCGRKWTPPREPQPRDHIEILPSADFGGVTDRGQRHRVNEDDMKLHVTDRGDAFLIVCDGVSSSSEADSASDAATTTILEWLSASTDEPAAALRAAIAAANAAVAALATGAESSTAEPPETTAVAAVVRGMTATIAWVGDSRAYWIDNDPAAARILTHDHSWMNDVVDSGEMTVEEASKNRLAHAITRCLGASDDPDGSTPSITTFAIPDNGGALLLCTDGFWGYTANPAQIAALSQAAPTGSAAVDIARSLVAWANEQGGRDNITAALLRFPAAASIASESSATASTEMLSVATADTNTI